VRGVNAVARVATRTEYLMFFPPRLTFLQSWERLLRRIPLGGQYVVVATKVEDGP